MKSKKTLLMCLVLPLAIIPPPAEAFGMAMARFFRFGSVAKNAGRLGRGARAASKMSRMNKFKSAAKGLAGAAAAGVIANEALEYLDFGQAYADDAPPSSANGATAQEPYSYTNTIKLGDPNLVW